MEILEFCRLSHLFLQNEAVATVKRGTLETKPLNVDGEVYTSFMKDKALPAIREKLPKGKVKK